MYFSRLARDWEPPIQFCSLNRRDLLPFSYSCNGDRAAPKPRVGAALARSHHPGLLMHTPPAPPPLSPPEAALPVFGGDIRHDVLVEELQDQRDAVGEHQMLGHVLKLRKRSETGQCQLEQPGPSSWNGNPFPAESKAVSVVWSRPPSPRRTLLYKLCTVLHSSSHQLKTSFPQSGHTNLLGIAAPNAI